MAVRIAITSIDNVLVEQHFGAAVRFQVYEIGAGEYRFIEARDTSPSCDRGETNAARRIHHVLDALSDCTAVLASCIGPCAAQELQARGMRYYITYEYIETALRKLITQKVFA